MNKGRRKNKLFVIAILVLTMIFTTGVTVFAAETGIMINALTGEEIGTRTVDTAALSFLRVSNTRAKATVTAGASGETPYITSKITLQEAPLGSTSSSDFADTSQSDTYTENDTSISHTAYFNVTTSKQYRAKFELTDKVNGIKVTTTFYKKLS